MIYVQPFVLFKWNIHYGTVVSKLCKHSPDRPLRPRLQKGLIT